MKIINRAMISGCAVSAVMALAILHSDHASAADLVIPEEPAPIDERMGPQWEATITPFYTWLPGIKGTQGVQGLTADVNVSAWDLIQNIDELLHALDGIYFGTGQIRQGNFGLFYDISYLDLSSTADFAGSNSYDLGERGVLGLDVEVDGVLDVSFSYAAYTLAGTYRFYETPETQLDAMIGARLTDMKVELGVEADISAALALGSVTIREGGRRVKGKIGQDAHWWDAIVGVTGRHNFNPNWYVNGWAMVGTGESDYVYDVMGGLGYEWNNGWSLYGGWRVVGTDYAEDGFTWDTTMSGPVTGLSVKF